jgi:hypothetical protein
MVDQSINLVFPVKVYAKPFTKFVNLLLDSTLQRYLPINLFIVNLQHWENDGEINTPICRQM